MRKGKHVTVKEVPALTIDRIARSLRTDQEKNKYTKKKCTNCGFPKLWYIHGCADCGNLDFTENLDKVENWFWPKDLLVLADFLEENFVWTGNGFSAREKKEIKS